MEVNGQLKSERGDLLGGGHHNMKIWGGKRVFPGEKGEEADLGRKEEAWSVSEEK